MSESVMVVIKVGLLQHIQILGAQLKIFEVLTPLWTNIKKDIPEKKYQLKWVYCNAARNKTNNIYIYNDREVISGFLGGGQGSFALPQKGKVYKMLLI